MGNADEYRANADRCFQMASSALNPDDERIWLNMAETWLGMMRQRQRKPIEKFENAARSQATLQEPSKSRH
jgi:hypothetical protein